MSLVIHSWLLTHSSLSRDCTSRTGTTALTTPTTVGHPPRASYRAIGRGQTPAPKKHVRGCYSCFEQVEWKIGDGTLFPLGKNPYSSCASEKSNQRNQILYSLHQGRADLVHFRSTLSLLMPNGSQRLIVSYRAHDSPPSTSC